MINANQETKKQKRNLHRNANTNITNSRILCEKVENYLTSARSSNQYLVTFQVGQEERVMEVMLKGALGYVYNRPNNIIKAKQNIRKYGMFVEEKAQMYLVESCRKVSIKSAKESLLSAKEIELLQLIADGYESYNAIANKLKLSYSTIQNHHYNILSKLKATSRTEALVLAYKQGLIHIT